ncbi:MAG TPA: lytic transglycosylase F [Vicinamibacterales bacterium]|nr:lytic transglycosylase F [Vicinamibacterales bacterium]
MPSRRGTTLAALWLLATIACRQPDPSTVAAIPAAPPAGIAAPSADQPLPPANDPLLSDAAIGQVLEPWTGDLDGIVKRRQLRMLVTFSKTNYFIDLAEQRGATYEAGKLFEEFLNRRLNSKTIRVHVVFIPVSRDRIFKDLAEGRGDIAAANLTITADRRDRVDFSAPLLEGVRERVVTAPDQPAITTVDDLSGREIYVRRSSSYYASLTRLNASLRSNGKSPVKIVAAPEALEDEDLLEMVNAGLMPATVVDAHVSDFWSQLFSKMRVTSIDVASNGKIAWAIRKGAPELRQAVDAFVRANPKGSKNFNLIYQRYLKSTAFVKSSSSASEMRKFQQLRGFFQKYGQQYSLPWLLLAAQGYQESELDQSVRSRAGAVGVMQIKPSTARGSPINITGVEASAEKNIQAGVKYLRHIMDQYYRKEPMDQLNRGLFAVASYNAGPARIAQLRRKARAMRLNPNVWFGNVEVVAAREIGRETVTYVSNIYKYYVSYSLVMRQAQERQRVAASSQ